MPNRILKESICTNDQINKITPFEETVFYRLIVNVDDFGRMDGRIPILKSRLFPLKQVRDEQIEAALRTLSTIELVCLYTVDGKPFVCLTGWERNQQIRAKKSRYPAPEKTGQEKKTETCNQMQSDEINHNQMQSNVPVIQSESESESESNARENARTRATHSPSAQKRSFGAYGNVMLTDEEYRALCLEYPDADRKIDRLSSYMKQTGKAYADHAAVIREWAREDAVKKPNAFSKTPEENDEFWNAAVRASYGKEFDGVGRRKEDEL